VPEAVEALGLKLPAINASKWGPVVILSVQLYILLLASGRVGRLALASEDGGL
jgi:hypothetical protein